jgi:hypothetical protein
MAPKAKASAPAHLVITGKLKGPPKISQDGSAIVVKKTLSDGATVQETFPKRRVRGKQQQLKQLIPAEDVIRTIEEATSTVASALRAEGDRKVGVVSSYANELLGREMEKASKQIGKERARARFQAGKVVAQKKATKAVKQALTQQRGSQQRGSQQSAAPEARARILAQQEQAQAEQAQAERLHQERHQRLAAQFQQRGTQFQQRNPDVSRILERARREALNRPVTQQQIIDIRRQLEEETIAQRQERDVSPNTSRRQHQRLRELVEQQERLREIQNLERMGGLPAETGERLKQLKREAQQFEEENRRARNNR